MSAETLLFFFAAIPSVLGAMIGVLAVFVVYAADSIQRSIEWSRDDLVRIVKPLGLYLESFGLDGQLTRVKEKIDALRAIDPNEPRLPDLEHSWSVIVNRRARRVAVTRYFTRLLIYTLGVIGASITALPFSEPLSRSGLAATVVPFTVLAGLLGVLVGVAHFLTESLQLLVLTNPDDATIMKIT